MKKMPIPYFSRKKGEDGKEERWADQDWNSGFSCFTWFYISYAGEEYGI